MKGHRTQDSTINCSNVNSRFFLFILWLIVMAAFTQIHPRRLDNHMVLTRLDLLHSLVYQHTLTIDSYHTNSEDAAIFNGHYYCDKAPGFVVVTLPSFYLVTKGLTALRIPEDSSKAWFLSDWITVATSISVVSATGAVCLFLWLQLFISARAALLCTLVIAFGSIVFPYSTIMMTHGLVVGFLCISFWHLRLGSWQIQLLPGCKLRLIWRDIVGGFACGMAVACEFEAALVVAAILATVTISNYKRGLWMTLGTMPPMLLIPIYNWACFGNPFTLPYEHEDVFKQMSSGFYGIHLPNLNILFNTLFGPERGLFFWTPFLFLAYPGYKFLFRESHSMFWLCYLVPLLHATVMSGYFFPEAGWTLGTRFLAPILPLLILPAGFAAARFGWFSMLLAFFSIVAMGSATLVDINLQYYAKDPIFDYYIPNLLNGKLTLTLGEAIGLRHAWRIFFLAAPILLGLAYLLCHIRLSETTVKAHNVLNINKDQSR